MKTKVLLALLIFCFVLSHIGCNFKDVNDDESDKEKSNKIARAYWGEWRIVKSFTSASSAPDYLGNRVSISENNIGIWITDSIGYTSPYYSYISLEGVSLKIVDNIYPGMLELNHPESYGRSGYLLIPIKVPSVSFTGKVVSLDSSSRSVMGRAVSGIGGIQVIIDNLNKPEDPPTTVITDTDGNFIVEEATPGDKYGVSTGGQTVDFSPIADGDDLGNITITNGTNFKINRNSDSIFYANENASISLSIKNIGSTMAQGTVYTITVEDGLILTSSTAGVFGTMGPGEERNLNVNIRCNPFSGSDFVWKKIFIEINDPINKKTWNDSVSVPFKLSRPLPITYKTIYFSCGGFDGHFVFLTIITPDGQVFPYYTYYKGNAEWWGSDRTNDDSYLYIEVPNMSGEYTLIVTNSKTSYKDEGMYTIFTDFIRVPSSGSQGWKYGIPNLPKPPTATDITRYKPNHTAIQASKVTLPIIAYSLRDSMDFYKIKF